VVSCASEHMASHLAAALQHTCKATVSLSRSVASTSPRTAHAVRLAGQTDASMSSFSALVRSALSRMHHPLGCGLAAPETTAAFSPFVLPAWQPLSPSASCTRPSKNPQLRRSASPKAPTTAWRSQGCLDVGEASPSAFCLPVTTHMRLSHQPQDGVMSGSWASRMTAGGHLLRPRVAHALPCSMTQAYRPAASPSPAVGGPRGLKNATYGWQGKKAKEQGEISILEKAKRRSQVSDLGHALTCSHVPATEKRSRKLKKEGQNCEAMSQSQNGRGLVGRRKLLKQEAAQVHTAARDRGQVESSVLAMAELALSQGSSLGHTLACPQVVAGKVGAADGCGHSDRLGWVHPTAGLSQKKLQKRSAERRCWKKRKAVTDQKIDGENLGVGAAQVPAAAVERVGLSRASAVMSRVATHSCDGAAPQPASMGLASWLLEWGAALSSRVYGLLKLWAPCAARAPCTFAPVLGEAETRYLGGLAPIPPSRAIASSKKEWLVIAARMDMQDTAKARHLLQDLQAGYGLTVSLSEHLPSVLTVYRGDLLKRCSTANAEACLEVCHCVPGGAVETSMPVDQGALTCIAQGNCLCLCHTSLVHECTCLQWSWSMHCDRR
jgi:hypothetical protein